MPSPRLTPRRAFWWTLIATLLVQAAWVLVLPSFRGIDEFDHVYRAAAVGHGQFVASRPAPRGRGNLVVVPDDVQRAASRACTSRIYTLHDNCYPESVAGPGEVRVASAAATYNPVYYALVGTLSRPFHGEAVDYAIRVLTALLAAALFAWAAAVTARWSRGGWPMLAFPVIATPVLVYSTTVASPNGIQYCAGVLFWCALIALTQLPDRLERVLVPLTVAAVTLMCTHTTGAMWMVLITLVLVPLIPVRRWWAAGRERPLPWLTSGAVILVSALACLAWILTQHTNALMTEDTHIPPLTPHILVRGEMLWVMQSIAVFPMRDQPAPLVVYAVWCTGLILTAGLFLRRASRRERLSMAILATFFVAVPAVLTMLSFSHEGLAWQGRYALPLGVGFGLLAGRGLARRQLRLPSAVIRITALAVATTAAACLVKVHLDEHHAYNRPSLADRVPGGPVLAVVLCLASAVAWLALLRGTRSEGGEVQTDLEPVQFPADAPPEVARTGHGASPTGRMSEFTH